MIRVRKSKSGGINFSVGSNSNFRVSRGRTHYNRNRQQGPMTKFGKILSCVGLLSFLICFVCIFFGYFSIVLFFGLFVSLIVVSIGASQRQPLKNEQKTKTLEPTTKKAQNGMIICAYCESENEATTRCTSCGATLN